VTPQTQYPSAIQPQGGVKQCPGMATADVGDALRSDDPQWLADLATLERIEQQALYPDPCFFSAMGALAAGRSRG
jgi:hypothetical protein